MPSAKTIEHLPADPASEVREGPRRYPPVLHLIRLGFATLGRLFPAAAARLAYRFFSTPQRRARHRRSDEILESARLFEFMYGRHLLKGYEWGRGGRSILLVHGWESRGTALRSFVRALVDNGFRVVAFDGPAHGHSGGRRTNLHHFAGAVRAAIQQVGPVHGIIAHSFGGASTVFALSHLEPELRIERLVLIGVPNEMKRVLGEAMRTLNLPKKAGRRFIAMIEQKFNLPVEAVDVSRSAENAQVGRILVVHDKRDPIVPFAAAESIFDSLDNASLLVVDGFGHYRVMKKPEVVERVVRFVIKS